MKKNSKLSGLYLGILFFLMYLPIGVVVVFSFNEARLPVRFTGFSLKWYQELFQDRDLLQALKNSLILAVSSCGVSAVIGTLGAVGLSRIHWKTKGVMEYISILPLMIPEIILGMVLMAFFYMLNLPFGMLTLLIGHTVFLRALYFDGGKSKACGNGSVPGRGSQRSWCRFLSGLLGHYPAADHAGCYIRLSAGLCHVHGRCGDQYFCNRATCIHAADKSLHTDENRRYAGDQCTLYHNAGSDPSGTGSISDRRKTREGEYKR